jgi:hypothetical protein
MEVASDARLLIRAASLYSSSRSAEGGVVASRLSVDYGVRASSSLSAALGSSSSWLSFLCKSSSLLLCARREYYGLVVTNTHFKVFKYFPNTPAFLSI